MSKSSIFQKVLTNNKSYWGVFSKKSHGVNRKSTVANDAEIYEEAELARAKPFDEIPGDLRLPFIGSAWTYLPIIGRYDARKLHVADFEKKKKYGDVVRDKYGPLDIVTTFKAEDFLTLVRHEGKYPSRGVLTSLNAYRKSRKQWYSSTGVIILSGEEWRDLRSKVQRHIMKPKNILLYLEPTHNIAKEFVRRVSDTKDIENEVPELITELQKCALESVALIALDAKLGCLQKNLSPESETMHLINSIITIFQCMNAMEAFNGNIQVWRYFPTPIWKKFCKAGDYFSEIAHKYINQAVDNLKNKPIEDTELSLLQQMLIDKRIDTGGAMVTATDMLFGGVDTIAMTVGYFILALAKNPEKQQLVYEEIIKLMPSKSSTITAEIYQEQRFMKACLKESMRLLPLIQGHTRTLDHDVVMSGYRVPAGVMILLASHAIFKEEKYFKNADKFLPERWLSKEDKPDPYAFQPFGLGPRMCLGRRFAEMEIICIMTEIIRNFKVEYHHEGIDVSSRMINVPDRPLRITFIER